MWNDFVDFLHQRWCRMSPKLQCQSWPLFTIWRQIFFFFLHITFRRNIFLLFQFPWRFEETLLQVWIFWGEENISNTAERVTLSFKITEEHSVSFFFAIARIKKIKQHQERQEMRSHAHELCEVRQLFWDIRRSNWLFLLEFLRVNSSWALLLRPN